MLSLYQYSHMFPQFFFKPFFQAVVGVQRLGVEADVSPHGLGPQLVLLKPVFTLLLLTVPQLL